MESLLIFTTNIMWAFPFTCALGWGWELSLLMGHLCSWDMPSNPPLLSVGTGIALLTSLPLLQTSLWLFLYVLSNKTSVLLVFRWLFRLIVLWFSCNFDEVLGIGGTYFAILDLLPGYMCLFQFWVLYFFLLYGENFISWNFDTCLLFSPIISLCAFWKSYFFPDQQL